MTKVESFISSSSKSIRINPQNQSREEGDLERFFFSTNHLKSSINPNGMIFLLLNFNVSILKEGIKRVDSSPRLISPSTNSKGLFDWSSSEKEMGNSTFVMAMTLGAIFFGTKKIKNFSLRKLLFSFLCGECFVTDH